MKFFFILFVWRKKVCYDLLFRTLDPSAVGSFKFHVLRMDSAINKLIQGGSVCDGLLILFLVGIKCIKWGRCLLKTIWSVTHQWLHSTHTAPPWSRGHTVIQVTDSRLRHVASVQCIFSWAFCAVCFYSCIPKIERQPQIATCTLTGYIKVDPWHS